MVWTNLVLQNKLSGYFFLVNASSIVVVTSFIFILRLFSFVNQMHIFTFIQIYSFPQRKPH